MPSKPHEESDTRGRELNQDPITGEPGAHPVGTGVGAAAGGATGAAIGSVVGPIGTAVGAVIGAVAGGLAGKGVAEMIDPTAEDSYWRERHARQPYADVKRSYEDYAPAYRTGYSGYREGKSFEEREAELRMDFEGGGQVAKATGANVGEGAIGAGTGTQNELAEPRPGESLRWEHAREAARAAYERVHRGEAHRVERK